jgi:hypothetical protein
MAGETRPTRTSKPTTAPAAAASVTPDAAATDAASTVTEPIATVAEAAPAASEPVVTVAEPVVTASEALAPTSEAVEPIATPEVVEPVPVPGGTVPAEVEAVPSAASSSSVSRRNRALGRTGQVAAIVGIVVSLALIVGVLLGRGWLVGKVDDVAGTIDSGLAKGVPLIDNASAKISEVSGRVGAVEDAANALAANPNPAPGLSEALQAQMTPISDRYLALRTSYTTVRTTVGSALDRLNTLDQMLPWFSIPQGPGDALQALDTRFQSIDATVTSLLETPGSGAVNAIAAAIATKAGDVQARLDTATAALDDANTRLAALRVNVQTKADQVKTIITLVSLALILGLLYSAFLHWVLFRASAGRRRRSDPV